MDDLQIMEGTSREMLPPELLLDDSIPANDKYLQRVDRIRHLMVAHTQLMRPKQVTLVNATHRGLAIKDAATEAGYSYAGAANFLKSPPAKELLALLKHLNAAIEGPNVAQRMNMLYRIAQRLEISRPRAAIAAIEVMNKMTHSYQPTTIGDNNQINIQINGQTLPRTVLDDPARQKSVTIEQQKQQQQLPNDG